MRNSFVVESNGSDNYRLSISHNNKNYQIGLNQLYPKLKIGDIVYGNFSKRYKTIETFDSKQKVLFDVFEVTQIKEIFDKDLSKIESSITGQIESLGLISKMNYMTLTDIKETFIDILDNPDVSISHKTRNHWKNKINPLKSKYKVMEAITNLYLSGSNLGLN